MEKLDHLVTRHVSERVLMPERLGALLQSVVDRRVKADAEVQARIDELSRERTTSEGGSTGYSPTEPPSRVFAVLYGSGAP